MHKSSENEPFKLQLSLTQGVYQYKFLVDGVWQYDPSAKTVDDGIGGKNNIIEVKPTDFNDGEEDDNEDYFIIIANQKAMDSNYKIMNINYTSSASWVAIKGSWDNWKEQIALKRVKSGQDSANFYVALKIAPGNYQFKFIVDGQWTLSPDYPILKNKDDPLIVNNLLNIPSYFTLSTPKPNNLEKKPYLLWHREDGKWAHGGKIHHTLQGHSMNVICDNVYIFGGMANVKFTNTMYVYNPRTAEFSIIEDQSGDIPEPRAFHHTMVFGTKLLVYGGFNQTYLTDYYIFNTVNNVWGKSDIEGESPGPRERSTLVPFFEDKLIHFGGYYCSPDMEVEKYYNDVRVLCLSQMEWLSPEIKVDEGCELPLPRYGHTANVVKKRMYVFGGFTQQQKNLNELWMLEAVSFDTFKWKKLDCKGTVPEPRHGHSAVTIGTNIIYFGGRGNGPKKFYEDLSVFDTLTYSWIYPLVEGVKPTPRYYHGSVSLHEGSELLIFGGTRPKEFWHYPRMYILKTNMVTHVEEEEGKKS